MKTYDITIPITSQMPVWPGDPGVQIERVSKIEAGDSANVSHLSFGAHTGTHVDAPYHFIAEGVTLEKIPLEIFIGRAYVVHLPDIDLITVDVLESAGIPPRTSRVLFKTRNSNLWASGETEFQTDFVALSADAAEYLVERGIELVGVDYLSVAPFHDSVPTHRILLGAGVVVVEGLDLSSVKPGSYTLYCLPLKLEGVDGAPARAILIEV